MSPKSAGSEPRACESKGGADSIEFKQDSRYLELELLWSQSSADSIRACTTLLMRLEEQCKIVRQTCENLRKLAKVLCVMNCFQERQFVVTSYKDPMLDELISSLSFTLALTLLPSVVVRAISPRLALLLRS